MESGMSSPFQTHAIKRISGIFFYIMFNLPRNMWITMYGVFRKALRKINMLPLIETKRNNWSGTLFEFNWMYIQGYSFNCGQCTRTWGCIRIVFFSTHYNISQSYLRVSFNILILRRRIKRILNVFIF